MLVLITLVVLALIALAIVSVINRVQEKEQRRRLQQRKLRLQADAITDIVTCLEQTIPNRQIIKLVNDEAIVYLKQILALETGPTTHIENSIRHSQLRSDELQAGSSYLSPSYQKDSDAQIAQTQLEINEAAHVLRHICAEGKITEAELEVFTSDLNWAFLMVSVASYIGQGHKFTALSDRFSAQGFYQKAQQLLMESMHPDPRRLRMIKELGEIIDGSRTSMSRDLLPERAIPALES